MERALVIGASGGIGAAFAAALDARGAEVTGIGRAEGLDYLRPDSVAAVLGALSGPFDTVLVATGILAPAGRRPEKALSQIDAAVMAEVLAINTIGPALVLAHLPRLLPRDRRAAVGVLSARVGSIGDNRLGGWHSYRASKAALNQLIRTMAIEQARRNPEQVLLAQAHKPLTVRWNRWPRNGRNGSP